MISCDHVCIYAIINWGHFKISEINKELDNRSKADSSDLFIFLI